MSYENYKNQVTFNKWVATPVLTAGVGAFIFGTTMLVLYYDGNKLVPFAAALTTTIAGISLIAASLFCNKRQ